MLNRIVSPSCKLFNATTRFVSFGPGLTLLVVLTVITAACVTAQNKASVALEKSNVGFFIRDADCQFAVGEGERDRPGRSVRRLAEQMVQQIPFTLWRFRASGAGPSAGRRRERSRRPRSPSVNCIVTAKPGLLLVKTARDGNGQYAARVFCSDAGVRPGGLSRSSRWPRCMTAVQIGRASCRVRGSRSERAQRAE